SRAGASAVALWTTVRLLPLEPRGAFAQGLEACREAARILHQALEQDQRFAPLFPPELDIVVWAVRAETASESSARAGRISAAAAERAPPMSLATFPCAMLESSVSVARWDAD